ncbi:MAG: 4-(cytidine 5'-diphospho)-2-C-methyl-D-erythritol kinase [Bryobacteraceae bacterium]
MSMPRRARVRALAKINLDLRVLYRRPDRFHELRSIFHTISLGDVIDLAFTPGPRTQIGLESDIDIPDNLVARAARTVLDAMRRTGRVELGLHKNIPMGAGLGGGSTDAAAVLLALPVLAGGEIPLPELMRLAAGLGSDVPYFLLGGRAAVTGRGEELYPLAPLPAARGLVAAPGVHVSTPEAYRALSPRLTAESQQNKIVSFQSIIWEETDEPPANDFEPIVFEWYPELKALKGRLAKLGGRPVLMTGSGSAIFGLFDTREKLARAVKSIREVSVFPFSLVSRARYRSMWWRQLRPHSLNQNLWPPRSRYVR